MRGSMSLQDVLWLPPIAEKDVWVIFREPSDTRYYHNDCRFARVADPLQLPAKMYVHDGNGTIATFMPVYRNAILKNNPWNEDRARRIASYP